MAPTRALRLWPGVVIVAVQWLLRFGVPLVLPDSKAIALLGGAAGGAAVLIWWVFFSRAPKVDRWAGLAILVAAMAATPWVLDPSIATGMMGFLFPLYAIPTVSLALVIGAAVSRGMPAWPRLATLGVAIVLGCVLWALVRTEGITGEGDSQFAWRWSPTAEEQLLARTVASPQPPPPAAPAAPPTVTAETSREAPSSEPPPPPAVTPEPEWPGFRGPNRDGVVPDTRLATDWSAHPPVRMWRRAVGPGWSSFAVQEGRLYTQEQRGEEEIVACYRVDTGVPVWTHADPARFWESNAGAGPRGTPTLVEGKVYTMGATGILNALDADTGARLWSRNAATDTGAETPGWGFSSSPLAANGLVLVAASGSLAAYDASTGEPRWTYKTKSTSYSSPQILRLGGVPHVVLLTSGGPNGLDQKTGTLLWQHRLPGFTCLQPALTADGDILVANGDASGGQGTHRLAVSQGEQGWTVEERWASNGLKPYFNDLVVHKGYAYGFDGRILSSIDLKDGQRRWKGGRYGNGQLVLLPDQDLLLVLSEEGELALVSATPDQFQEVARFPAIEGKTWNHPVLAGDVLLVRNDREMAAFRLAMAP